MTFDHLILDVPEEHEMLFERPLDTNSLRVMELIHVLTVGVDDAWADERAIEALARTKGWRRANGTLLKLSRLDLVEGLYGAPWKKRPHAKTSPKPGTVWRLTLEGRLERYAQRGRVFA